MTDNQVSPLRTTNTENETNHLRGGTSTLENNIEQVNEHRRSGMHKSITSEVQRVLFFPTQKKSTFKKINYSKSGCNKSQSSIALNGYKIKPTIRQIIDKGVKFNLAETIIEGEKGTKYNLFQRRLLKLNLYLIIALVINIIIVMCENQFEIKYSLEYIAIYKVSELISNRPLTVIENILLSINLLLSIFCDILLIIISLTKVNLLKIDNYMLGSDTLISSKKMLSKLIRRIIIASIFYPPGINSAHYCTIPHKGSFVYSWSGIISIVSMLKIVIVIESLQMLTIASNCIKSIVCRNFNIKANLNFSFKSQIKQYPLISLFFFFGYLYLLFSMMISNFEYAIVALYQSTTITTTAVMGFNSMLNTLWFIFTTMITVAYGDIKPMTIYGNFISIFAGMSGYLLMTLFLISISNYSEFSFDEMKAFYKVKTLLSEENNEKKASNIVKAILSLRLNLMKMNKMINKEERKEKMMKIFALSCHIKVFIRSFHNDYTISRSWSIPVDDLLINLENSYGNDCGVLNKTMKRFNVIEDEIKIVENSQLEIEEEIRNVAMMQKAIAAYIINLNNNGILYKFNANNLSPNVKKWTEGYSYSIDSSDSASFPLRYNSTKKRMSTLIKEVNEDEDSNSNDSYQYSHNKKVVNMVRGKRPSLFQNGGS